MFVGEEEYTLSSQEENGQKGSSSICRRSPCNSCVTGGHRMIWKECDLGLREEAKLSKLHIPHAPFVTPLWLQGFDLALQCHYVCMLKECKLACSRLRLLQSVL